MSPNKPRKNFHLRLQPYQGTMLAEVVDYLNSKERDEVSQQVANVLLMCFLPLARRDQGEKFSAEELRFCCLEACDALSKHASFLRLALRVPQPQFDHAAPIGKIERRPSEPPNLPESQEEFSSETPIPESLPKNQLSPSIQGKGSAADVEALFGEI